MRPHAIGKRKRRKRCRYRHYNEGTRSYDKEMSLDFPNLPDGEFDELMGESTGAALIFGSSGGFGAAARTAQEWVTGEELENLDFTALRGLKGIRKLQFP